MLFDHNSHATFPPAVTFGARADKYWMYNHRAAAHKQSDSVAERKCPVCLFKVSWQMEKTDDIPANKNHTCDDVFKSTHTYGNIFRRLRALKPSCVGLLRYVDCRVFNEPRAHYKPTQ